MPHRHATPRRLMIAVAVVAAPTAAVLLILVLAGQLSPLPALLALIVAAGLLAVLMRRHLAHLAALAGYLRSLGAERGTTTAAPPAPHGPLAAALAPDLSEAAAESGRAWTARRRELEGVVSAKETILSSLPDPLILLDGARRVVRANPAADALFGQPIAGRDLVAMLRNPALVEAVDAVLAGGTGRVVEFSLTVPMERSLSARVERLPQRLADGTVCLISLHDLTQIKKADQMRADFVANASHELRTPLSTLTGFIETLMGPARDDAEARERFLAIMHEQAARMGRLVGDLLSLSRIELNEHSAPVGEVKLDRVIGSVADILQLKASGKSMRIEIGALPPKEFPAEASAGSLAELPEVTGDPDELAQVFQNLIDNAIKYGRPGSAIRISGWLALEKPGPAPARPAEHAARMTGRRPPVAVAVAIADEGEGIPREHLPRLTERFYRVDSARSRDLGGTGLGLAIVKHIVSRHRGGLRIESSPGVGSVFTVFLPVAPAARERLGAEAAAPESLPPAGQAARHGI